MSPDASFLLKTEGQSSRHVPQSEHLRISMTGACFISATLHDQRIARGRFMKRHYLTALCVARRVCASSLISPRDLVMAAQPYQ